jgi:DNA-binding PucR family transcriptional regulator
MILGGPAEEREAFVRAQLGPLLADQMGEDLVRSLDAYYAAGNSVAAAARDLYVHRHTLEYRLQRIETLLGKDVKAPEHRLLLELALAIRDQPA